MRCTPATSTSATRARLLAADRAGIWGGEQGNNKRQGEEERRTEGEESETVREEESARESQFFAIRQGHEAAGLGQTNQVRSLCKGLETALPSPCRSYAQGQDKFLSGLNLSTEKFQSASAQDPSLDGPGPYPACIARRVELTGTTVVSSTTEKCHSAEDYLRRRLCPSALLIPLRKALPSGK